VPAIGMVHDDWMIYGPLADAWTRAFLSRPRLARLAERLTGVPPRFDPGAVASWLFVSQATRRRALDHVGTLPRAEVAHSGIDTVLFRPAAPRAWSWRLLYLGRIDERKGIDLAIDALTLLPLEATLEVIGRGDAAYLERLRSLVAARGLAGRVRFGSASREELPRTYADADALLFPVRWPEPFGLVPVEAMAAGTPVVATGRGGSGEYLGDEENCLIFDPDGGPEALAAAARRLAEDERLRARLREGGFATAARLDERSFNERVAAALERAANAGPARSG
jgi:glycogen(starch) synthase